MPFRVVPARDRKLFRALRRAELRSLRKGAYLYREGDIASQAYVVEQGHLQLKVPKSRSTEANRTVAVVGPGEVCGLECLEPDGVRRYTCRAGEPVQVRVIAATRLAQAVQGTRWTLGMLFKSAHADLVLARSLVGGQSSHRTAGRLARVLLDLAGRFGTEKEDGVHVPRWLTHQELADLCGAHRSTVTTMLNEWIYEGALDERTGTFVIDRGALTRKAAQ